MWFGLFVFKRSAFSKEAKVMRMARRIEKQGKPRQMRRVTTRDLRGNNKVVRKPPMVREVIKESDTELGAVDFSMGDRVIFTEGENTPAMRQKFGLDIPGWEKTGFRVQGYDSKNGAVRIETGKGTQVAAPWQLTVIAKAIPPIPPQKLPRARAV